MSGPAGTNHDLSRSRLPGGTSSARSALRSQPVADGSRLLRRAALLALLLASTLLSPAPAFAQREGSPELRKRAEDVLSGAEFRHLIRAKKSPLPSPRTPGGDGDGDGEAGDGDGDGSGRWGRDGKWRSGKNARNRKERSSSDDSSSSSSFPSFGGALGGALGPVFHGLAWLLIAVVVGLIVWLVIKAISSYQAPNKLDTSTSSNALDQEPDKAPGDTAADVYVARARELAAQGLYREAVAHLLLGAMSHTERAGLIRFRRGLTHRDYLRALRPKADRHRSMQSMVDIYEPLGFGRREATRDHFERTLSNYEAGFHATSLGNP